MTRVLLVALAALCTLTADLSRPITWLRLPTGLRSTTGHIGPRAVWEALGIGPRAAWAQRRRRRPRARRRIARRLLHNGMRRMSLGQYMAAAKAFGDSYRYWPLSRTLFLWGQSLELAGELLTAARLYQRLLDSRVGGVDHKVVRRRLEHIKQQLKAAHPPPTERPEQTPARPAPPARPAAPARPAPKPLPAPQPQPAAPAPMPAAADDAGETETVDDDATETLEDPEEERDDTASWKPTIAKPGETKTTGLTQLPVRWGANALMRFAFDTGHEGGEVGAVPEDVQELFGRATATIQYRPKDWIRLKLSGQLLYRLTLRLWPGEDRFFGRVNRHEIEGLLQPTFVEFSTRWFDLALGMMTTVWGVNDLVNPNDVLSAKDLRQGPPVDPESIRFATPTVKAEAYVKSFTLSAVWIPLFLPDRIDLFGSDFAFFGPGAPAQMGQLGALLEQLVDNTLEGEVQPMLLQTRLPRPVSQSAVAARVALSEGGWDVALQYAYTYTSLPVYRMQAAFMKQVQPMLTPNRPLTQADLQLLHQLLTVGKQRPFEAIYQRYHQAGLSVATSLWKLVASLDLSYRHRQPQLLETFAPSADLVWLESNFDSRVIASTLGLRYTYGEELLISVEGWYELQIDTLNQPSSQRPQLVFGGPHRAGIAGLARYIWTRMNLTFEVTLLSELVDAGFLLAPHISYRVGDHLRLFVGANILGGTEGSTGRTYTSNDIAFLGVQGYL